MSQTKPSKPQPSRDHKLLMGLGGVTSIGALALLGYGVWSANHAAASNQQAVMELTGAVQQLAQQPQQPRYDDSQFASAIDAALERREDKKRQAIIDRHYKRYDSAPEERPGDNWLYGNPDARFTLIEFADTECSYCKRFHDTPKSLIDDSDGLVNWQFEHLAILGPKSVDQAVAAECFGEQMGNRGFFVFMNEVFERTGSGGRGAGDMSELAEELGANGELFSDCLDDNDYVAALDKNRREAQARGITGTPATLIIDNETGNNQLARGAQPAEAIASAIRGMLSASQESKG